MGNCQSRSCYQHIAKILSRETGKPLYEISFPSIRAHEKPLPIKLFYVKKANNFNFFEKIKIIYIMIVKII